MGWWVNSVEDTTTFLPFQESEQDAQTERPKARRMRTSSLDPDDAPDSIREDEQDQKDKEKENEEEEEKKITLAKALMAKDNRGVATSFAKFVVALAVVPVVGLLQAEYMLRGVIEDKSNRWSVAGVIAVLLVNAVMGAFVYFCFQEGFDSQSGGSSQTDSAVKKDQ